MRGSPDPSCARRRGDLCRPEPPDDLAVLDAPLAETDNPSTGFGRPIPQDLIPFGLYADGDPIAELPVTVSALPEAVHVLVPR